MLGSTPLTPFQWPKSIPGESNEDYGDRFIEKICEAYGISPWFWADMTFLEWFELELESAQDTSQDTVSTENHRTEP